MKAAEQLPAIDTQPVVTVEQYAAALRAEIVKWTEAQKLRCARHDDTDKGIAANCCVCWRNSGLDIAIGFARGQHGPTPEAVAERLRRGGA